MTVKISVFRPKILVNTQSIACGFETKYKNFLSSIQSTTLKPAIAKGYIQKVERDFGSFSLFYNEF